MLRGFDVSHHQGTVDWADLKGRYAISFGACKATEGTTFLDNQFKANWSKLAAIDVVRMAYHYPHPARDPETSADVFVDFVATLRPTDLLVLDLETGDGLPQATVNAWAKAWAARVRQLAPGHAPVLYSGHAYMENATGKGLRGPFGSWWYPRYPTRFVDQAVWPSIFAPTLPSPNAWGGPPDFWQYTASFPTPAHVLDANVYDGTLTELRSLNGDLMPTAKEYADAVAAIEIDDRVNLDAEGKPTKVRLDVMLSRLHANGVQTRDDVADLKDAPPGSNIVADLTDPALAKIAEANADEQARRQQA